MSTAILIKDPAQTTGINDAGQEALRLSFLEKMLGEPSDISIAKVAKEYLNSSLVGITYEWKYNTGGWKKNTVADAFAECEIFNKLMDYDNASFIKDCVNVIIQDAQYAMDQEVGDTEEKWRVKAIRDNLNDYKQRKMSRKYVDEELIPCLRYVMGIAE